MWGKRRKSKTTRAWGYRSIIGRGRSKRQPITRKRVDSEGSALDDVSLAVTRRRKMEAIGMEERLLRRREVEDITGLSRSTIYRMVKTGQFPPPVRVGPKAVRWRLSDIIAWLESRPLARKQTWSPHPA